MKLWFIDEVGNNNNMVVQHGWAEKGKRSYAEQFGYKTQRLSIVAAYNRTTKQIIAPFEYSGYTDTHLFNGWFEHYLLPNFSSGDVVIMDNAKFHKDPDLADIAAERGVQIIYLPSYSPDLNPIEKFWANLKRNIRKVIKTCKNLQDAITLAFNLTVSG